MKLQVNEKERKRKEIGKEIAKDIKMKRGGDPPQVRA